jgi:hypothetical protein
MPAVTKKSIQEWLRLPGNQAATLARLISHWRRGTLLKADGEPLDTEDGADYILKWADTAMGTYGVEAIRGDYHVDNYYYDIVALYVNTGDTYNATLLYETENERFVVTTFGDWVEKNQDKYSIQ